MGETRALWVQCMRVKHVCDCECAAIDHARTRVVMRCALQGHNTTRESEWVGG